MKKFDMKDYLTITIGFNCNNNCISCMLGSIRKKLTPVSFEKYKKILDKISKSKKFTSLILSGAEITMNDDLIRFVKYAQDMNFFENIRIQTNGRKLADINYCKSLIKAGINEFFISLYGHNSKTHESLTRTKGSFKDTIKGIEHLNSLDAKIITNTVITRLNCQSLPKIPDILYAFKALEHIEFWNYWAMDEKDTYDLIESNIRIQKYLLDAIKKGEEKKIPVIIKRYPQCLLKGYEKHLNNSLSSTVIEDIFWRQFMENKEGQCKFKKICSYKECKGLTSAYIKKFGYDYDGNTPIR